MTISYRMPTIVAKLFGYCCRASFRRECATRPRWSVRGRWDAGWEGGGRLEMGRTGDRDI
eukprot:2721047-Rhodomonas_salina.1